MLFEEVVKGLPRVVGRRLGGGLSFDSRAGTKEAARVSLIFCRNASRERLLPAFPAAAGIEGYAVDTAVNGDATTGTIVRGAHRHGQPVAAPGTLEDFMRRHEIGGLRSRGALKLTPRRAWFDGLALSRRCSTPGAVAGGLVLISALSVLPLAHRASVSVLPLVSALRIFILSCLCAKTTADRGLSPPRTPEKSCWWIARLRSRGTATEASWGSTKLTIVRRRSCARQVLH